MARVFGIVLAILGLAYACLWWSFQRFYGQFGVSPQDVGLAPSGSASDIAGAALELGVWLMIAVAVLTVLPVAAVIAVAAARGRARRSVVIAAAAAGVLLGLTAYLYWWLVDHPVGLGLLAIAAALFGLLRVLIPKLGRLNAPEVAPAGTGMNAVVLGIDWATLRLALIVALAAAVVGMTFIDLPSDAADAGRCARNSAYQAADPTGAKGGKYVKYVPESVPEINLPLPGLQLPILSVHAQPATLTWLQGSPPPGFSYQEEVVYLGQSGGSVVVYKPRSPQRVWRLPASSVVIGVHYTATDCPEVHD